MLLKALFRALCTNWMLTLWWKLSCLPSTMVSVFLSGKVLGTLCSNQIQTKLLLYLMGITLEATHFRNWSLMSQAQMLKLSGSMLFKRPTTLQTFWLKRAWVVSLFVHFFDSLCCILGAIVVLSSRGQPPYRHVVLSSSGAVRLIFFGYLHPKC